MTAQFSNGDHENGNGNGATTDAPPKPHLSTKDGFTFHDRVLLDDTAIGIGLANKRIDAVLQDGKRRHEETRIWRAELRTEITSFRTEVRDDIADLKGEMLRVLAGESSLKGEIEQVRRGSQNNEFVQKAAEAHLAVQTASRTADIDSRKRRNAALLKYGLPALLTALGSVVTYLLTRL